MRPHYNSRMHQAPLPAAPGANRVVGVAELNRLARHALEQALPLLWVAGEVSNLTRAGSGHLYFSLKDAGAVVRCVMFRSRAQLLPLQLANGMRVELRALVTIYEARGDFQLNVETVRHAGAGALYEAFARLRDRLAAEGLFEPSSKRPLPRYPGTIGVVTSCQAAALKDVLAALRRRSPHVPVIIYPVPVQGEGAAHRVAGALQTAGARAECDVVLLVRGGGSIEDLWSFNEEIVARAIRACLLPVVSGVGHEADLTIADFAADQRAATPTAAAELVSAGYVDAARHLPIARQHLRRTMCRIHEAAMQRVDLLAHRLLHPGERIARSRLQTSHLHTRLSAAVQRNIEAASRSLQRIAQRLEAHRPDTALRGHIILQLRQRLMGARARVVPTRRGALEVLAAHLAHLDPRAVLARGYAVVRDRDGELVRDSSQIDIGDELRLEFASGTAAARVTAKD